MSAREMKAKEPTQKQRFIDKARELGCDEDEAAFDKRLRKIAKAPSKSVTKVPAATKRSK